MSTTRLALIATAALSTACGAGFVTRGEAADAVKEASFESQAHALTSNTVELSTNFTLGQGLQNAAEELRGFISSQLACAEVTRQDATLTVEYGAKGGACLFRGQVISGTHTIGLTRVDADTAQVAHTWTNLSNGLVKVSGSATVTWSRAEKSRQVQHQLTFTRLADGATATGSGDRVQRALEGGVAEGIQIDGTREWTGPKGTWALDINGVQLRWKDPMPSAGNYELTLPKGATITIGFDRIDESTLRATVTTPRRTYTFKVRANGEPENESETET